MAKVRKTRSGQSISPTGRAYAERVGVAELRGNLAKYLRHAEAGLPVIIRGRNGTTYVLQKLQAQEPASVLGCMRAQTEYTEGTVVNSLERWSAGSMP